VLLVALPLLLASCNDWLDVRPRTEVTADELFKDEAGFKEALTSCYLKLNGNNLYGRDLIVTIIEFLAQHWTSAQPGYRNYMYEAADVQAAFAAIYAAQYNVIAQANTVLEHLAAEGHAIKTPGAREIIEAEALAIRAFCHFEVLRLFGQVPRDAALPVALPYAERVGLDPVTFLGHDEFLARVLRDFDAAETLLAGHDPLVTYNYEQLDNFTVAGSGVELKDTYFGYRRFRFNYHAVKALKARLYLYTGQRERAYALAKEVIDARDAAGNKVVTLAGAEDLNRQYYALPSECLLALHNLRLGVLQDTYFASMLYLTPAMFANDLFAGQSTSVNNRATIVWDATHSVGSSGTIYPTLRKYNQPGSSETLTATILATRRQVVPLVRLSEMYLIAMETSTDMNEVNALYAEYMQARNVMAVTLTEANRMTEIVNEYRREFFGEGQMFYTYKRLGATRMLWGARDVTERDYVAPLPLTEYDESL
jgi:hypothetical protein